MASDVPIGSDRCIVFGETQDGKPTCLIYTFPDQLSDKVTASISLLTLDLLESVVRDCTPSAWKMPSEHDIQPLLHVLQTIQVTKPMRYAPDPKLAAIRDALDVLSEHLPPLISTMADEQRRVEKTGKSPFVSSERYSMFLDLYETATKVRSWPLFPNKSRVRHEEWHQVALAISFHAKSMWRASRPGAGLKVTSPMVRLVEALLPIAGVGVKTPDAIVSLFTRESRSQRDAERSGNVFEVVAGPAMRPE